MLETDLVAALMSVGVSHRRAAAFERCLDDTPFCGISGTLLGKWVVLYGAKQAYLAKHSLQLAAEISAAAAKTPLELFESSAYGTHAPQRTTSGSK